MEVRILYGTQTGTAIEVSQRIAFDLSQRCPSSSRIILSSMNDANVWEESTLGPILLIFVVSTTGQGEIPATMQQTWMKLLSATAPKLPSATRFAVFGLGDSSYEKYNYVAKMLHNRLVQLSDSSRPLVHRGLGDDQDTKGYLQELLPWLQQLYGAMGLSSILTTTPPPWFVVESFAGHGSTSHTFTRSLPPGSTPSFLSTITRNDRITSADHFQDIREFNFDVPATVSWDPGDVVGVYPENPKEIVEEMCARLGVKPSEIVRVQRNPVSMVTCVGSEYTVLSSEGQCFTMHQLLTSVLDIMSVVSTTFLMILSQFTPCEEEQERLQELSSTEGAVDFMYYATRERRNYFETLQDFPKSNIPLSYLVSFVRFLMPRYFSIASAAKPMALTVGIVEYTTPYKRSRRGLCSGYLADLRPGDVIPMFITKTGLVHFQYDTQSPVILIGPGTGIAPCRAIAQFRKQNGCDSRDVLFYGCRYEDKDYLYRDEIEQHPSHYVAISRGKSGHRTYVQHLMQEPSVAALLRTIIFEEQGVVVISGNAKKMPQDVKKAFVAILQGCSGDGMSEADAVKYLNTMMKSRRYFVDA
eukprot:PhF_6_TR6059/c0_g1_i1/m.8778